MLSEEKNDELERRIPEWAEVALAQAYRRTLAAGYSVLVSDNGIIYEVFPDGTRKMIKQIEPPTLVVKGNKLKIGLCSWLLCIFGLRQLVFRCLQLSFYHRSQVDSLSE
jgi:hypothetical protein